MKCKKCGACCRNMIIEITGKDIARHPLLVKHAQPCTDDIDGQDQCYMLTDIDGCPVLDKATNLCTIYACRPSVCREFKAGSDACLWIRGEITDGEFQERQRQELFLQ